jgi:hypothetical protein
MNGPNVRLWPIAHIVALHMSAFGVKADIAFCGAYIRLSGVNL